MKVLVLRYANNIVPDCMEQHIKVYKEMGYCWFGKLGKAPGKKVLSQVISESANDNIILYMRGKAFLCSCKECSEKKPSVGYPAYYDTEFSKFGLSWPTIYFKLSGIREIDLSKKNYIVTSSRNPLQTTLNKSMNSFFIAEDGNAVKAEERASHEPLKTKSKKQSADCKYKINEKCSLKSFVNYGYICERPQTCIRQKV